MSASSSFNLAEERLRDAHVHLATLKFYFAVLQGEKRVIRTDPDIEARRELRPALSDDDRTGLNHLPAVRFHAQILRIAVAAVPRGALTLFMCHKSPTLLPI